MVGFHIKYFLGESVTKRTFDNVTRNEETRNRIRSSTSTNQGSTKTGKTNVLQFSMINHNLQLRKKENRNENYNERY